MARATAMFKSFKAFHQLAERLAPTNVLQASIRQAPVRLRPHQQQLIQRQYFSSNRTQSRASQSLRSAWHQHFARRFGHARWNSTNTQIGSPETMSLKDRMKKLSREYGWSALGVYLALSVLDFPFCFLLVRSVGVERIAAVEHWVIEGFWSLVDKVLPNARQNVHKVEDVVYESVGDAAEREGNPGWGVEAAQARNKSEDASIWTQLALAYAIHKSFIFIRVPLTAAVTPRVVKTLRSWGWNIGKRRPKPVKAD